MNLLSPSIPFTKEGAICHSTKQCSLGVLPILVQSVFEKYKKSFLVIFHDGTKIISIFLESIKLSKEIYLPGSAKHTWDLAE
jgi:uncharacterized protein YpmS